MTDEDIERIFDWLAQQGLRGASESILLGGFCAACRDAGLPIDRSLALIDTLHPVHEGRAFRWDSQQAVETEFEYGPSSSGDALENWKRSAFYHLWAGKDSEIRRRIGLGDQADFAMLDDMRASGHTDFVAFIHRFEKQGTIGEMDCFLSHFVTRDPGGFSDAHLQNLRKLLPVLALAIKSAALARIARTIAEVYLGRDAARRVFEGKINRGASERISAALWFSDLANYTKISATVAPEEIIPLLNDYSDAVISAVHEAGGTVLKLIGDGVLAIFRADREVDACEAALQAEDLLRLRLKSLNCRRTSQGRPTTEVCLGLHIGDVFYGNIGSEDRLDFTVIGPAVNEVSRIVSLCRSLDVALLTSSNFADCIEGRSRQRLACVGRFALKGVQGAQMLYTLDTSCHALT
ncbi:adenylate/guanylate cyclase domain-containing protein [Agrobacterium tumefaciens]|uniref:adenylate/guanylate cyclase domain-containing protein n=1 Tax=Agrobacterium tumefaciens TaxID=358 RepID=UPI0001FC20FC|nr:adenylate/guanylate cyclase domain-containing protein [Agrobacterium tumefaciens]ADY67744.1 putative adenylate/guanylate cyclase [Agrobacterium tumefaciens]